MELEERSSLALELQACTKPRVDDLIDNESCISISLAKRQSTLGRSSDTRQGSEVRNNHVTRLGLIRRLASLSRNTSEKLQIFEAYLGHPYRLSTRGDQGLTRKVTTLTQIP